MYITGHYNFNCDNFVCIFVGGDVLLICKNYVGISCVDGSCPCLDMILDCENCYCNKGCDDCGLWGSEFCDKNINGGKNEIS